MKRYLAILLALVLMLTSLAAVASAKANERIYTREDGTAYLGDDDGNNLKVKGWYKATETYQWEDDEGNTGTETSSYWVYGLENGTLKTGWMQEGSTWYYMFPAMASGWTYPINGSYCLFDESGAWIVSATKAGWVSKGNDWYYLLRETDEDNGETYEWFHFAKGGVYEIDGKQYAFDKNGKMTTGWIQPYNQDYQDLYWRRAWFYAKPDGTLATGWQKIDGDWYYFDESCRMKDMGAAVIDGKRYVLDYQSGKMISNQWYLDTWIDYWGSEQVVTGSWLYLGPDGVAKTGWFKDGNTWYYANEYGDMQTGWLEDGDARYYLQDSGAMAKNEWIEEGGSWKFIKGNGAMAENEWIEDGSAWYWMKDGGAMAANETIAINGKEYKFADNGVWIP